ncbi:MAG: hypothetical protein IKP73_12575, partial [Bacteroidales bacterium]|nr:hypothetical protein [Bacteroidales bacterium]
TMGNTIKIMSNVTRPLSVSRWKKSIEFFFILALNDGFCIEDANIMQYFDKKKKMTAKNFFLPSFII